MFSRFFSSKCLKILVKIKKKGALTIFTLISGQKGIGFKSVFRVSDCPEIHSNGFHIKFDASKGPNGYILPDWVETEERRFKYNFDGIL